DINALEDKLSANLAAREVRVVHVHIQQTILEIADLSRGNRECLLGNGTGGSRGHAGEGEDHRSIGARTCRAVTVSSARRRRTPTKAHIHGDGALVSAEHN